MAKDLDESMTHDQKANDSKDKNVEAAKKDKNNSQSTIIDIKPVKDEQLDHANSNNQEALKRNKNIKLPPMPQSPDDGGNNGGAEILNVE